MVLPRPRRWRRTGEGAGATRLPTPRDGIGSCGATCARPTRACACPACWASWQGAGRQRCMALSPTAACHASWLSAGGTTTGARAPARVTAQTEAPRGRVRGPVGCAPGRSADSLTVRAPVSKWDSEVLYLYTTDNSGTGDCGIMVLFHPRVRGPHHGAASVVVPTSPGYARVGLPYDARVVARRSRGHRIVKILELTLLLEVRPLASPTLRLVFRPAFMDTHRENR
jgi:hypothetical protein